MRAARQRRWPLRLGLALWSAMSITALADDTPVLEGAPAADDAREQPDHLVVLRISKTILNSLVAGKTIDRELPVSEIVLGTPVAGMARVVGEPRVELQPSEERARFAMIVTGTVQSRTRGRNGPAVIDGHSITHFTASKPIVFEPGQGFYGLPPQVATRTECYTDGIRSTRGGLVGRVVVRRASQKVAGSHAQVTAIARERATRRIQALFDSHVDERLRRLNQWEEMRSLMARLRDGEEPRLACRTTQHHIEIAGAANAPVGAPIALPAIAGQWTRSPIEIWIHASVAPENVVTRVEKLLANPDENDLLRVLALMPGTVGKETAAAIHALTGENRVGVRNLGEWVVVDINPESVRGLAGSQSIWR
jgi:hypothetical protein